MFTFCIKLEKWSFQVADLPRTGKKCRYRRVVDLKLPTIRVSIIFCIITAAEIGALKLYFATLTSNSKTSVLSTATFNEMEDCIWSLQWRIQKKRDWWKSRIFFQAEVQDCYQIKQICKNLLSTEWIGLNLHRKKVTESRVVSVSPSSRVNRIEGFSFNLAPENLTKSMNASLSTNQSIYMFTSPIFHQRLSSSRRIYNLRLTHNLSSHFPTNTATHFLKVRLKFSMCADRFFTIVV